MLYELDPLFSIGFQEGIVWVELGDQDVDVFDGTDMKRLNGVDLLCNGKTNYFLGRSHHGLFYLDDVPVVIRYTILRIYGVNAEETEVGFYLFDLADGIAASASGTAPVIAEQRTLRWCCRLPPAAPRSLLRESQTVALSRSLFASLSRHHAEYGRPPSAEERVSNNTCG